MENYQRLTKERIMVDELAMKNNTINAAYRDSSIIVTSRYYEYIALTFTALLLVMLFFRFASNNGVQSGGSSTNNTLKIIIVILFVAFYFNRKKIYNQITI